MTLEEQLKTKIKRWQKQIDNSPPHGSMVQQARDETMQQMITFLEALLSQQDSK